MDKLTRLRKRANSNHDEKAASIGSALKSGWKGLKGGLDAVKGGAGALKDTALDATQGPREFMMGAPIVGIGANEIAGRPITSDDVGEVADELQGSDESGKSRLQRLRQQRRSRRR